MPEPNAQIEEIVAVQRQAWNSCDNVGARYSTDEWKRFYAGELLLYFPPEASRVLELGCGNGDLYPYFRDRCSTYTGVDFSEAMIARFQENWPDVDLKCCDAITLPDVQGEFDVIFSNGLIQYFNVEMVRHHLQKAHQLLSKNGTCLLGNVPDRHLRAYYHAGCLRDDRATSLIKGAKTWFRSVILKKEDGIGHWFSRPQINHEAYAAGFDCRTFSSASYEYKFHARLRKR
jgi:cyclopropane fatty-acyl-phospholipid synthase-like methyltransferase